MNFLKNKSKEINQIFYLLLVIVIAAIFFFVLKFSSHSFINSEPDDWNIFLNYLSNIINPILALLNLFVFLRLTKSIQRASENKSWVERTENLTFELIDNVSKEASFLILFTTALKKIPLDKQNEFIDQQGILQQIEYHNNIVSESQFKLRLFIENDVFRICESREDFLQSINNLLPTINNFLNVYAIKKIDKSRELMDTFQEIENSIKNLVENGKRFCDEVYYL